MPSDDYASITRGPLKLKGGAGVTKKKKKKDKTKAKSSSTDLEKNLSTGGEDNNSLAPAETTPSRDTLKAEEEEDDDDDAGTVVHRTPEQSLVDEFLSEEEEL